MIESQDSDVKKEAKKVPLAVRTRQLRKRYAHNAHTLFWSKLLGREPDGFDALKGIDVEIPSGSCFGILGLNGSGKSTFLQLLAGIMEPTSGTIETHGKISAILELGSGFNNNFTGRENIAFYSRLVGVSSDLVSQAEDAIIEFAEIGDFIDRPLSTYSSGMVARLGFATRAFLDFDVLILDEVLAVGDAYFQRKCFRMLENMRDRGKTIIFVSHSVNQVLEVCDQAMLLHEGELLKTGDCKECAYAYFEIVNRKHAENRLVDKSPNANVSGSSYGMGGCILDACESSSGSVGNAFLFRPSERVELKFRFTAKEDLLALKFGLTLRSTFGSIVAGSKLDVGDVGSGASIVATITFTCVLNPSHFFLSCGLTSIRRGQRVFEARYLDFREVEVTSDSDETQSNLPMAMVALFDDVKVDIT